VRVKLARSLWFVVKKKDDMSKIPYGRTNGRVLIHRSGTISNFGQSLIPGLIEAVLSSSAIAADIDLEGLIQTLLFK
jgi:hypothetical protein